MSVRIYADPTRVTISKPGYDARNPPAVDYKYLALDSRLPIGRPLEIGTGVLSNINNGGKYYYFTQTYPIAPAVEIMIGSRSGDISMGTVPLLTRDTTSSTHINRAPYWICLWPDKFCFTEDAIYYRNGYWGMSFSYFVWPLW